DSMTSDSRCSSSPCSKSRCDGCRSESAVSRAARMASVWLASGVFIMGFGVDFCSEREDGASLVTSSCHMVRFSQPLSTGQLQKSRLRQDVLVERNQSHTR